VEQLGVSPRHPNWDLAETVLFRILPGSTGFDPEQIAGLAPERWRPFDIDDREPTEVASDLLRTCQSVVAGVLIVVTFESYRSLAGPFFVSSERLGDFVSDYQNAFNDVFVAGDVVIASPATSTVVVVHHSGLIATLFGPESAPRSPSGLDQF
jgi:hypothetical protein